ncbi:MAG TPA: hypothetical protein VN891_06225, partial [Steroidobacteraceae bacterium]|nr:hypothetical protein [Steroidobacteraceae bacterium]
AWLGPEIGWQSMDVTHTRPAVRTYCRLAVGRDYLDAAPVRGMRRGGGGEKMEANVLITRPVSTRSIRFGKWPPSSTPTTACWC